MPKPRREGYLLIDHRDSPGITPEQAGGRGVAVGADRLFEGATVTCLHCNAIVVLNPGRTRPRHYCPSCDGYICDGCGERAVTEGCRPLDKLLDYVQDWNGKMVDLGIPVGGLPDLTPLWSRVSLPVGVSGIGTSLVVQNGGADAG